MSRLPRLILLASLTGVFALDARAQGPEPQPDTSEAPEPPPDPNKVRAKQLFEQGAQAYAQKHYKDAIDLFLSADRLVQSPAFPYNIAKAYREMGDTANALRWAREYLRRSPEAANRDEVEGDISRYEVRLAEKGVMQLTVRSSPSGATVLINGEPVGVTPWTGERVPGAINVLLRLRGYEERAQTLDLGAEHTLDVTVPLEAESATPPPPSPTPTPTPTPTPEPVPVPSESGVPLWPFAVAIGGLGVGGIMVGGVLESLRAGAESDAQAAVTQIDAAELASKRDGLQLGARVAVGIGAGLVAVGATLLIVDLTTGDEPESVALACGFGGCQLRIRGDL